MFKQGNFFFEEGDTIESSMNIKEMYYNCTECSSPIELININEKRNIIEFKCTKDNHIKKIPIKEYLKKMKKFNDKKVNDELCIEDNHNKKYEFFCLDCNKHLCKECLKTRNHISHNKKIIIEIQPSQKELDIINNIIKSYEDKIENLEKEKFDKIKELKNKFKESENKLKYDKKIKRYNYDEKIENINSLKILIELIYNTYNMYNNNYYNSININNTLISIFNNQIYINDDLNNEYENIIKIKNETINNKKSNNKNKIKYNKNYKLDNIISIDFSEKIFSYLIEKRKLEIIHYNKRIQNELNININNYKTLTGKYLKYETIVKEYNYNGKLEFEGEYLNGKRNGKGKEYNWLTCQLEFEGEYLNGERNGMEKDLIIIII